MEGNRMNLIKVVALTIGMMAICGIAGYKEGKRASDKYWQVTKVMMFPAGMNCWECGHLPLPKAEPKAEGDHQTLKWKANPIPYDGNLSKARQYFNCSYIHDRTITCTLFNDPGPDDIIEAFVHKKGDKMEMYIIDYYPPDGTIMSTTPPVKDKVDPTIPYTNPDTTDFTSTKSAKVGPCSPGEDYQGDWCMMILPGANMIEGKVCHYVESTNMTWCIYKPNYKPKGCAKAGECEPTNYWVICDDGYVRFGKAIVDDDLKVKACGLHGAVDTRRIHISSTEGKDWKVIVTPINPKGKLEDQK